MKNPSCPDCHRRDFLRRAALGSAALFTVPGAFADALTITPAMTEGPFYPDKLPLDTDNDLVRINDTITPGVGAITHLHGRVTDVKGNPIPNARVEIWQVDHKGAYIHSRDGGLTGPKRDDHFQGFGRFMTARTAGIISARSSRFLMVRARRTFTLPSIAKTSAPSRPSASSMVTKGNAKDGLLKRMGEPAKHLMVQFKPIPNSKAGELSAEFNIVLGVTPDDGHE
jgi:protocatechuate 3,4-dioxygenase beta subunit